MYPLNLVPELEYAPSVRVFFFFSVSSILGEPQSLTECVIYPPSTTILKPDFLSPPFVLIHHQFEEGPTYLASEVSELASTHRG